VYSSHLLTFAAHLPVNSPQHVLQIDVAEKLKRCSS